VNFTLEATSRCLQFLGLFGRVSCDCRRRPYRHTHAAPHDAFLMAPPVPTPRNTSIQRVMLKITYCTPDYMYGSHCVGNVYINVPLSRYRSATICCGWDRPGRSTRYQRSELLGYTRRPMELLALKRSLSLLRKYPIQEYIGMNLGSPLRVVFGSILTDCMLVFAGRCR
jgi:hypothetical protein